MKRKLAAFTLTGACLAAGACAMTPPPKPADPQAAMAAYTCDASAAQGMIGMAATADTGNRIQAATGSSRFRWLAPNSVMTMDYRKERVNVYYDDKMVITKITCG